MPNSDLPHPSAVLSPPFFAPLAPSCGNSELRTPNFRPRKLLFRRFGRNKAQNAQEVDEARRRPTIVSRNASSPMRTYGIRFYAYRADDGGTKADCRINGLDWPEGIAALQEYAPPGTTRATKSGNSTS
jgi:hypothetical protein